MTRRLKSLGWVGVGALAVIFIAWGATTAYTALRQRIDENRLAKIESPCLRYGAKSEQCKEAFEQAVLTITHPEACAILRKAGLRIIPCAHARLRQERRRHKERVATRSAKGGGALHTPTHTAHQHPGPRHGGPPASAPAHHHGAATASPQPSAPAPSAPQPAPTVNPAGHEPQGHAGTLPSTLEAAGGAASNTANGALCTATDALHPCPGH